MSSSATFPALATAQLKQIEKSLCLSKRCKQIAAGMFAAALGLANSAAHCADHIRIAAQITGTLSWELEVPGTRGLDRQANLDIETTELASTEGGQIALKGGAVDLILSDWIWVSRERALGDDLVFYPYSSTLGAMTVPANSPIEDVIAERSKTRGRRRSAR